VLLFLASKNKRLALFKGKTFFFFDKLVFQLKVRESLEKSIEIFDSLFFFHIKMMVRTLFRQNFDFFACFYGKKRFLKSNLNLFQTLLF